MVPAYQWQIVNTISTPNQASKRKQRQDKLKALIANNNSFVKLEREPSIISGKFSFKLVFVRGVQQDMAVCTSCSNVEYINDGLENHQCAAVQLNDDSTLEISNNKLDREQCTDKFEDDYQHNFMKNQLILSAAEMFPLERFNDTGFRKITSYLLNIGAKYGQIKVDNLLCNKKALANECRSFVGTVKLFLKKIVSHEKLVLSCDMWNDPNHFKRCITLSCHYIDDNFALQQSVLGTRIYNESDFDGEKLVDYVTDILGEYTNVPSSILLNTTIVTNKKGDFLQSFQKYSRMNCMCSVLNEVANEIFALKFLNTHKVCTEIIERLKKQLPNQKYSFAINNYQSDNWLSMYDLFDAYEHFISSSQCGKGFILNYDIIQTFLNEFQKASKLLSSSCEATISTVYLIKQKLIDVMRSSNIGSFEYPTYKEQIAAKVRNNFEITNVHWITLFLDPRYKSLKFLTSTERSELYGTVREMIGEIYIPDENLKILKRLGEHVLFVDSNGAAEVDNYLNLIGILPDTNVLEFWKQHLDLPKLRDLAKQLLCIPATSDAWECYFNKDKFKLSRRRLQLDLSELDATLLLNGHSRYGLFDEQLKLLLD